MEIGCLILEKIEESLVDPIKRQFGYLLYYNRNKKKLKDKIEDLDKMRAGVQQSVDAAKKNLEIIGPDVEKLLKRVDFVKQDAMRVLDGTANAENTYLNLRKRYLLSKRARRMTKTIFLLQRKANRYTELSYSSRQTGMASISTDSTYKDFLTRKSIMRSVVEAVKNADIGKIGIWGVGGVGKTTMVEEVAKRVESEKTFDRVVMVILSKNPDTIKIQDQIADTLGLKFETDTSILARAKQLLPKLRNRERILLILDDVWNTPDLTKIGIPFEDDHNGCKVILTSRSEDVCRDIKPHRTFEVKSLSEQEAWDLFKETAGNSVDTSDLQTIVKDIAEVSGYIAEVSGCLPLAILTIGRAIKNKDKQVWVNELQRLYRSTVDTSHVDMDKKLFSSIELSFNFLERDETKSLLLLCCLFPQGYEIPIESLVRYGLGLELFPDVETLADTRMEVYFLVQELISCYLLDIGRNKAKTCDGDYGEECVKMHDAVREVCLSIASKDENVYKVRHDPGLKKWSKSEEDTYESYTAISLASNEMQELPAGLECPKLKLLRLVSGRQRLKISREFFKGMDQLRVVDFSIAKLVKPLPSSIQCMVNLRILSLHFCNLCFDISLIGSLQELVILSFFGSELDVLPSEIHHLSNLKLLDLTCTSGPSKILAGFFTGLNKLEELYMGDYFVQTVEECNQEHCASIIELNSLSSLKTLHFDMSRNPWSLLHFNKCSRQAQPLFDQQVLLHTEKLYLCCLDNLEQIFSGQMQDGSLGNLRTVIVRECDKLLNVAASKQIKQLQNLKQLEVASCHSLEAVFDFERLEIKGEDEEVMLLENLESMELFALFWLKHIWKNVPTEINGFQKLVSLKVDKCDNLRYLLSPSVAKMLVNLQEVRLKECKTMGEVIKMEEDNTFEVETKDAIAFHKLGVLVLEKLENLKAFCSATIEIEFKELEKVVIIDCPNMMKFCSVRVLSPDRQIKVYHDGQLVLIGNLNKTLQEKHRRAFLERIGIRRLL